MVTLALLDGSRALSAHMAVSIGQGMSDKEFMEREISAWLSSKERREQLDGERYYHGDHDILQRKRMAIGPKGEREEITNLPNNRIVDNQYAKMIDQKANYLCGRPLSFDTKSEEYGKLLTRFFGKSKHRQVRIIAEKALMGGKAWVLPYYNDAGELTFAVYPAHEILPFWADSEHTELDCAVHFFGVYAYNEQREREIVYKAEILHGGGIDRFIWQDNHLIHDNDADSGAYVMVTDAKGEKTAYNWERIPLVCFKYNHHEIPLLNRIKTLQDSLNLMESDFLNAMEEDSGSAIIVLQNYEGENLGEFRRNLMTYRAVKVTKGPGTGDGGVDTLEIEVNAENYNAVMDLMKKAIIENARGYDAKDERMSGNPNQMNIRSMYSDIDLDANGMETEFQAGFEELLWFVNTDLKNRGQGGFEGEDVTVIFDRDILVNETEVIEECKASEGILSEETIIKNHPWVSDPEEELARKKKEQEEKLEAMGGLDGMFGASIRPPGGDVNGIEE